MKITFKQVLFFLGAILGITGFCMMFLSPLKTVVEVPLFGEQVLEYEWQKVFFGFIEDSQETLPHAQSAMWGYILLLGSGLIGLITTLIPNKKRTYLVTLLFAIFAAVVAFIGAILIFTTKVSYLDALQIPTDGEIAKAIELNNGVIFGGVLGLAAAIVLAIGGLFPSKRAKKDKK